jgi:hypothetical protein
MARADLKKREADWRYSVKYIVYLWASATCLMLPCVPARTLAWGPEGHKVVALIAEKYISHAAMEGSSDPRR